MRTLGLLASVLFVACSGSHGVEPTPGSTSSVTIDPAPPPIPTQVASASCDKRTYAREITFGKDGKLSAQYLVSPCPPGARCVWSGILARAGTFSLAGSTVTLTVTEGADSKPGSPLPATMTFTGGALSESAGGATCAYQRR